MWPLAVALLLVSSPPVLARTVLIHVAGLSTVDPTKNPAGMYSEAEGFRSYCRQLGSQKRGAECQLFLDLARSRPMDVSGKHFADRLASSGAFEAPTRTRVLRAFEMALDEAGDTDQVVLSLNGHTDRPGSDSARCVKLGAPDEEICVDDIEAALKHRKGRTRVLIAGLSCYSGPMKELSSKSVCVFASSAANRKSSAYDRASFWREAQLTSASGPATLATLRSQLGLGGISHVLAEGGGFASQLFRYEACANTTSSPRIPASSYSLLQHHAGNLRMAARSLAAFTEASCRRVSEDLLELRTLDALVSSVQAAFIELEFDLASERDRVCKTHPRACAPLSRIAERSAALTQMRRDLSGLKDRLNQELASLLAGPRREHVLAQAMDQLESLRTEWVKRAGFSKLLADLDALENEYCPEFRQPVDGETANGNGGDDLDFLNRAIRTMMPTLFGASTPDSTKRRAEAERCESAFEL